MTTSKLFWELRPFIEQILKGTMLAFDPASGAKSDTGWAYFEKGKLIESGILKVQKKDIYTRLRQLSEMLDKDFEEVDVLAVEKLRSKAHTSLRWSAAVIIVGVKSNFVLEVPPQTWHSLTEAGYIKSDEADAIAIGEAVIKIAKGTKGKANGKTKH